LYNYYNINFNADSVSHYLNNLINIREHNLYYLRKYAEFLYEQNKNIELADSLTQDYANYGTNYADHWTPYLKAHSMARHGNTNQGLEIFDTWMTEYSKPENFRDNFSHYYFYTEFTIFYNIKSKNAVKYAEILEDYQSNVSNKKRLAKLYLFHGEKDKAINKLREVRKLYEDPNKKIEIDELIKEYEIY